MEIKAVLANYARDSLVLNQLPKTFGYLKNTWSVRLLATHLTSLLGMNVSPKQTWRIIHDLGECTSNLNLSWKKRVMTTKKRKKK